MSRNCCARRAHQTKVLLYKNFTLSVRNWKNSIAQLVIPLIIVLFLFLLTLAFKRRAGENNLDHPSLTADYTVGKIPRCTVGRGKPNCYTFAYNHADDPTVQTIINYVLTKNGLTNADVAGLTGDADATEMNAFLLANENITQAAYVFHFNATKVAANPALFLGATYTLQLNNSVYTGTCGPENRVQLWNCPQVSRDIALPMQRDLSEGILRVIGGTGPVNSIPLTMTPFGHPAFFTGIGWDSGPLFMLFALMFPMVIQLLQIVKEREVKLQYHLKLVGLTPTAWWLSWWIQFFVFTELSYLLMIGFGYAYGLDFFWKNDFGTFFFLFFIFGLAMVATVLFFSTLFLTVRNARILALAYLFIFGLFSSLGALVYADNAKDTVADGWRYALALLPPLVLGKALNDLFKVANDKGGIRFSDIGTNTEVFPLKEVYWWLAIDTGICLFFAWYGDQVLADIMGSRKKPWFFLTPSYWGCGKKTESEPLDMTEGTSKWRNTTGRSSRSKTSKTGTTSRGITSKSKSKSSRSTTSTYTRSRRGDDAEEEDVTYDEELSRVSLYSEEQEEEDRGEDSDVVEERDRIEQGNNKYVVVIDNLVKRYETTCNCGPACSSACSCCKCCRPPFQAVDGLTLGMEDNTLLCLLGPNGAGKTTTIHIMTGGLTATSGDIYIRGYRMSTDPDVVRAGLGVCPQFDVLWDELTGEENLHIFASLKDLQGKPVADEVEERLQEVDLADVRDRRADKYSGGMRRRLCVAIALTGDPRLVFLDEPTTGMDPVSRRQVWDIIERAKKNRAVILTTHSMEEADVLGDRIAIMAKGQLQCVGTSVHLKQRFGSGYRVVVLVAAENHKRVRRELKRDFPDAEHVNTTPVAFKLQINDAAMLPELFKYLKNNELVKDFQISLTTLEDVFLKIAGEEDDEENAAPKEKKKGAKKGAKKPKKAAKADATYDETYDEQQESAEYSEGVEEDTEDGEDGAEDGGEDVEYDEEAAGSTQAASDELPKKAGCCLQFAALVAKNWHLQKRKRLSNLCQICMPSLLIVVLIMLQVLVIKNSADQTIQLVTDPPVYPMLASIALTNANSTLASAPMTQYPLFQRMITAFPGVPGTPFETGLNLTNNIFNDKAGADAYVYSRYLQTPPVAGGWLINDLNTSTRLLDFSLYYNRTTQANFLPMPALFDTIFAAFMRLMGLPVGVNTQADFPRKESTSKFDIVANASSFIFPLILFFQFPVYVGAVLHDKENKLIEIMRMMGMRMSLFWVVHALFDLILYLLVLLVLFILGGLVRFTFFTQNAFLVYFILFLLWGFAMIAMSFLFTTIFAKERTATIASYFFVILSFTAASVINNQIVATDPVALFFYSWHPFFAFFRGTSYLAAASMAGAGGIHLADLVRSDNKMKEVYGFLIVETIVFTLLAVYLNAVLPVGYGVKKHCCFCFQPSYWRARKARRAKLRESDIKTPDDEVDNEDNEEDDIREERERVLDQDNADDYAIRMVHLRKVYDRSVVAVRNANFGIRKKEAFGLLGQNGAGKTTIASMLSGLIEPTSGNAFVSGYSIRTQMESIYGVLGVCPQHDLLWGDMTAREHLMFFGRIKGLAGKKLKDSVAKTLKQLNLEYAADRVAGGYSGGMKRRLSIGQALIGSPKVIFLDEPTTGLDPKNRRDIWKVISEATTQGDAAVVLTTHSMEEAEALCDRLGIMVTGRLEVVGTSAELKRRYSAGYALTINMAPDHVDDKSLKKAHDFIRSILPRVHLDAYSLGPTQHFHVAEEDMKLDLLFRKMDEEKDEYNIVDWAVSQTTLDDVFLQINTPDADIGPGGGKAKPKKSANEEEDEPSRSSNASSSAAGSSSYDSSGSY